MAQRAKPESSIHHLLYTNFVPSDAQRNVIRAHLDASLKRLDRLDAEMSRLQTTLPQLVEQREQLCADIAAHDALVSPARRMPPDITQEIFICCLPIDRNSVVVSTEALILLGQICKAWRGISLSIPCLWSAIHIVVPGTAEKVKKLAGSSNHGSVALADILPELRAFEFEGCLDSRAPFLSVLERTRSLKELTLRLRAFRLDPVMESLKTSPDLPKLKLESAQNVQLGSWFAAENQHPHQEFLTLLTASDAGVV
ncbi:hypothetical protein K438DRAFT_38246 [Mycena galopus ATCC 62051]|nr:hypothetical protein K438DRAFT_38246 [Mycena galopus ATCC 62051]